MAGEEARKKRMLVVDDDGSIRTLLEEVMKLWGFEVVTAPNGREGLEVLKQVSVDGILLDLHMPVMDGHSMLDELRCRAYHLPIIVMSGGTDEQGLRQLLDEGAQEFLLKPFDLLQLKKISQRIFGQAESGVPEIFTPSVP